MKNLVYVSAKYAYKIGEITGQQLIDLKDGAAEHQLREKVLALYRDKVRNEMRAKEKLWNELRQAVIDEREWDW